MKTPPEMERRDRIAAASYSGGPWKSTGTAHAPRRLRSCSEFKDFKLLLFPDCINSQKESGAFARASNFTARELQAGGASGTLCQDERVWARMRCRHGRVNVGT
jgi:hypothetical protein